MKRIMILAASALACASLFAQPGGPVLEVDASAPGIAVPPTMWGVFLEDINFAADGGLYPERVLNRSFEYPNPLEGWTVAGSVEVRTDGAPFERNPHYVRLSDPGHPAMTSMLQNSGWFGIGLQKGEEYKFSFWARTLSGKAQVGVMLCDPSSMRENQNLTYGEIEVKGGKWARYELSIIAPETLPKASLRVFLATDDPSVSVDLEHISLMPSDTFCGLRRDLAEALADLRPGILRFPGGCIVEGVTTDNRYQWKNTVGPVENRVPNLNRWSYCTFERMFPDYWQSGGLGFYEYFVLAEAIGAEPVPIISCGMACQFQNDPSWATACAPMEDMQTYIQDALDLIEFANGSARSKWGKVRAQMGHPEPFGLKYLGVGNEQWGSDFLDRFALMTAEIRAKHPEIAIVGTSGPYLGGEWFDELWAWMRALQVDLVDEHYYSSERFFEGQAGRYDDYPRTGPGVFAGEFACHGSDGKKFNHFNAALVEASFMTGLERNCDLVRMTSYAPTFAHVEGWQWRPDLIWFDNLRCMRTSSYWVQWLYSRNRGTRVVPITLEGAPVKGQNGLNASCAVDDATGEVIIKIANLGQYAQVVNFSLPAVSEGTRTVLHCDNPVEENTLDEPARVAPVTSAVDLTPVAEPENPWIMGLRKLPEGKVMLSERLGGRSFCVYRFKL